MSTRAIEILVRGPRTGYARNFRSINAVAKMLSGTGKASGGLRKHINETAYWGGTVRNNRVDG